MRAEEAIPSRHPFRCHHTPRPAPGHGGLIRGAEDRLAGRVSGARPAELASPRGRRCSPDAPASPAPAPAPGDPPGPVVPLPRLLPGPRLCSVSFPLPLSSFCSALSGAPPLACSRESLSKCTPPPILLSPMVASQPHTTAQAETRLLLESPTPPPSLVLTPGRFFCLSNNSFLPNKDSDNHLLNTLPGPGGYILQPCLVFSLFEV